MILYKYTQAKYGLQTIRTNRIRFTQMDLLNDPFESRPPVERTYSDEEFSNILGNILNNKKSIQALIVETVDRMYAALPSEKQSEMSKGLYGQLLLEKIDNEIQGKGMDVIQYLHELGNVEKPSVISQARNALPDLVAKSIGILSLTYKPDDELMWANYADQHNGVLIGFDSDSSFFTNGFKVIYAKQRPKIDMSELPINEEDMYKRIQSICGIKNEDWQKEQEYRLARPIKTLEKTTDKDKQGNDVFVGEFPLSALHVVVLGSKISSENKSYFLKELSDKKYSHVKLLCAHLNYDNYTIQISNCN
jgi:hypothetical protein